MSEEKSREMSEELRKTIAACLKDPEFAVFLREEVMKPIVKQAVESVIAEKDAEIAGLKQRVVSLESQFNDLEQYSRRNCLNISGVTEQAGENTDELVMAVATAAGVTVRPADIDRSHRVGKKQEGRNRPITVKFTNFGTREKLYENRKDMRASRCILPAAVVTNCFISENLTPANARVLYIARRLRRSGRLHSAWTNNCRIKVRLNADGETSVIRNIDDLRELVGESPEFDIQQTTATPTPRVSTAESDPATRRGAAAASEAGARGGGQSRQTSRYRK